MSLFGRNTDERSDRPGNPDTYFFFRLLAAGYLLYLVYDMFRLYREQGEDAPSLALMIGGALLLGGGAIWIAVISWKQWRAYKKEQESEAAELLHEAELPEEPDEEE